MGGRRSAPARQLTATQLTPPNHFIAGNNLYHRAKSFTEIDLFEIPCRQTDKQRNKHSDCFYNKTAGDNNACVENNGDSMSQELGLSDVSQ